MSDIFSSNQRMAMLIDGDNAQPSLLGLMIAEASKYGAVTVRRIYGDWTKANMSGWKDALNSFAVQPIQQFRYTVGKNATDSAMIIDAMDILYTVPIGGFCLVSSDSDYTRLATRIREKGAFVMGIGNRQTPRPFVSACEVFVYAENLIEVDANAKRNGIEETNLHEPLPKEVETLFVSAFDLSSGDDNWAQLGLLGQHLRQLDPSFDSRTYGHKQLSQLVGAHPELFEVKKIKREDGTSNFYVRLKKRR